MDYCQWYNAIIILSFIIIYMQDITGYYPTDDTVFTGKGLVRIPATGGSIGLTIQVDRTGPYSVILRYIVSKINNNNDN